MNQIKTDNIGLNIAADNVSISIAESHSQFSMLEEMGMWGACMFGEPCIFGQGIGYPIQWNMIGESEFGSIGILGMRGTSSIIASHQELNVIRTN